MRGNVLSTFLSLMIGCSSGTIVMAQDAHRLARQGGDLTKSEKRSLDERVVKDANDIDSRTILLGYYFIKGRRDPDALSERQRHILWLIEHKPDAEVLGLPYGHLNKILESEGYDRGKKAWLKVVEKSPKNLAALSNASNFFLIHDREIAERLLLDGQEQDEKNPEWYTSLGQLYTLGLISRPLGPDRTATANKAFRQFKLAYDRSDETGRQNLLSKLAKTAIEAEQFSEARKYAELLLASGSNAWNRGNSVHHGNLIIGQLALHDGNIEEAKARLLEAGKTSGSPQLNSFGPNMTLAKLLLEHGEDQVVLEYLELCKSFWKSPHNKLETWIQDVKDDRIPEFGANLAY